MTRIAPQDADFRQALTWDFHRELARLDDGFGVRRSSSSEISPLRAWGFRRAVLETEAVVSGFENVAAVGDGRAARSSSLRRRARQPLAEAEISRDDDAGALVELAQQMGEQGPARGTEWQVAKLIEIGVDEPRRDLAGFAVQFSCSRALRVRRWRRTGRAGGDARWTSRRLY